MAPHWKCGSGQPVAGSNPALSATAARRAEAPPSSRFRRGDPASTPTIGEIRERADLLAGAMTDVPTTWQLARPSLAKAEHLARVGWFHELYAALYGPIEHP
jgi:hypothetical protein